MRRARLPADGGRACRRRRPAYFGTLLMGAFRARVRHREETFLRHQRSDELLGGIGLTETASFACCLAARGGARPNLFVFQTLIGLLLRMALRTISGAGAKGAGGPPPSGRIPSAFDSTEQWRLASPFQLRPSGRWL